MIFSFGAKNYFSFREGMNISFQLNSKVPFYVSKGLKASTVLGLKGANASGKTNILKCLTFLGDFITSSFDNEESEGISFDTFFETEEPSEFFIDFEANGTRYIYELTATPNEVITETIYKKVTRKTPLITRTGNEIKQRVSELEELDIIQLKKNASITSSAHKYKFKSPNIDLKNIVDFFVNFTGNVYPNGIIESRFTRDTASYRYYLNPEAFEFAKAIIRKSDLGIMDIEIHENKTPDGKKTYIPIFLHGNDPNSRWLTSWDESSGTLALYNKLWAYWEVIESGGVLIMDEFDINCHNMLLPRIIDLFQNEETNKNNAQFIFTAHSTEIIDYLGKYRTILVNKENGESYCYRLDEIKGDLIRNDRSIAALYREGKIGGVPR